jgi:hypothetical protein
VFKHPPDAVQPLQRLLLNTSSNVIPSKHTQLALLVIVAKNEYGSGLAQHLVWISDIPPLPVNDDPTPEKDGKDTDGTDTDGKDGALTELALAALSDTAEDKLSEITEDGALADTLGPGTPQQANAYIGLLCNCSCAVL